MIPLGWAVLVLGILLVVAGVSLLWAGRHEPLSPFQLLRRA